MKDTSWKLISTQTLYESKGLTVEQRQYESDNGQTKKIQLKKEGPFVNIFALTEENKVLMIRQFRPGLDRYMYETPAGSIDPEEDPAVAAARELKEETGYQGELTKVASLFDAPYSTAERHIYIARNCHKVTDQSLDEDEYIENVLLLSLEELRERVIAGEVSVPETIYLPLEKLQLIAWSKE